MRFKMHTDACDCPFPVEAVRVRPDSRVGDDWRLIVLGSWLIAVLAQVRIPIGPVPITGQTLGVLLVGALLGSRQGPLSVSIYLGYGLIGLPFFAGGTTGIARLMGPTGGYLVGFVVAALVVGFLSERGWRRRFTTAAAAMVIGNVCVYAVGLPWLASFIGARAALRLGLICFIPGDVMKLLLAAATVSSGWLVLSRQRVDRR